MWTDSSKDRFYDAVKDAARSGADPSELLNELEQAYYLALDEIKRSAQYAFTQHKQRSF